jgi:hypothetical protein
MDNTDLVSRVTDLEASNKSLSERVASLESTSSISARSETRAAGYVGFDEFLGRKYFGNEYNEWLAAQPKAPGEEIAGTSTSANG